MKTIGLLLYPAAILSGLVAMTTMAFAGEDSREYYKPSTWQPGAHRHRKVLLVCSSYFQLLIKKQ